MRLTLALLLLWEIAGRLTSKWRLSRKFIAFSNVEKIWGN